MKIGLIRHFPDTKAAEHENLERLKKAIEICGHESVEIDKYGFEKMEELKNLDVILNLHFESPKLTLVPQIGFLWNPISYYSKWGFEEYFFNQLTMDWFVSCGSNLVDDMVEKYVGKGKILGTVNHSVPFDWKEPKLKDNRKLFYVGVNWETLSGLKGRHSDLLNELSRSEILDVYGPKKIQGVKPWSNQVAYKGEIPFDGFSLIDVLAEVGAALVLSSDDHIQSGILSNRFFEGLASGVPIIIGKTQIPKYLEIGIKYLYVFDDSNHYENQAREINEILRNINKAPKDTIERIRKCQDAFKNYSLNSQMHDIIEVAITKIAKIKSTPNLSLVYLGDKSELCAFLKRNFKVLKQINSIHFISESEIMNDESYKELNLIRHYNSDLLFGNLQRDTTIEYIKFAEETELYSMQFTNDLSELFESKPNFVFLNAIEKNMTKLNEVFQLKINKKIEEFPLASLIFRKDFVINWYNNIYRIADAIEEEFIKGSYSVNFANIIQVSKPYERVKNLDATLKHLSYSQKFDMVFLPSIHHQIQRFGFVEKNQITNSMLSVRQLAKNLPLPRLVRLILRRLWITYRRKATD